MELSDPLPRDSPRLFWSPLYCRSCSSRSVHVPRSSLPALVPDGAQRTRRVSCIDARPPDRFAWMVTIRDVEYDAFGNLMVGRLALPAGEGVRPAVLIAHEGPGLDDYQKD